MFAGLSAFPVTPMDDDGVVQTDELAQLVNLSAEAGVASIGLLGSTGSYMYLSDVERGRAIATAREAIAGRVPLIVGVGAMRTDGAVQLAKLAAKEGADGVLLAPVSYTPLTQEEAYAHYVSVAEASDLPMCIYNNPGTTHFQFGTELLGRLSHHQNIKAVKMPLPAGDMGADLAAVRDVAAKGFQVGYSADWGCTAALLSGADGWFSAVGGLLPRQVLRLSDAAMTGDVALTAKTESPFLPLWDLCQQFGSLRVIYAAARQLGMITTDLPRPLLSLPTNVQEEVEQALEGLLAKQ